MATSFFNGTSTFPENNTTDQLIDALKAQLADSQADSQAAIDSATAAAASAKNASISEENVSGLAQQASDSLNTANAALSQATALVTASQDAVTTSTQKASDAAASLTAVQAAVAPFLTPQSQYTFTAAAGQTVWNAPTGVTFVPGTAEVFVNGIRYNRTESFSDSTGNSITFVNPLTLGYSVALKFSPVVSVSSGVSFADLSTAVAGRGADLVAFKQSGAGTVGRTVQDEFREQVKVTQFGAKTGGNTADGLTNRQAFQAAIVELQSRGGGEIFVPAGRYALNVAVPIIVPSNIRVRGIPGSSILVPDVSTIVDVATRPFPQANGAVFVSGNPSTGQRSAFENSTGLVNIHFDGIEIECTYTTGTLASGQQLRGISIFATNGVSVTRCRVENLPNTGIVTLGCLNFTITNNRCIRNGYGQPDAYTETRNGISAAGYSTFANRLTESYSGVIAHNECNYNHDEGIQYGFTCGLLIEANVCIGNGDLGIEGDTAFATTTVAATLGHEVPSQAVIVGNYVDGRREDGTLGMGGIGFGGGNEGTAKIANNIIRNVSGKMGIAANQNNGGQVTIENNQLFAVDPGAAQHQIQSSVQWVKISGNTILNPGSTNAHNAIFCFGNAQTVILQDNYSEAVPTSFARIGIDNAGFARAIVTGNTCLGTGADGIILAPSLAVSIAQVVVSGNTLSGVNSSGATDKRAITIKAGASTYLASIASLICRNNTVAYAGATQYPIGLINLQAGSIASAEVRSNSFGSPSMPSGTRSYDSTTVITALIESNNVLSGTEQQNFAPYNVFTDSSNYERGAARWISNEFVVGSEKAGTGTARALAFQVGNIKTWKIDVNGHLQPYLDSTYDLGAAANRMRDIRQSGVHVNSATVVTVPTTGQTVTVANRTNCQICDPAGALAALTVQFPVQVGDGHEMEVIFTKAITTLTLTPSAGQTIIGGLTSTSGYLGTKWRYWLATNTWYRIQ